MANLKSDLWHSLRLFLYASKRKLSFARRYFENALMLAKRLGLKLSDLFLALESTASAYQGA